MKKPRREAGLGGLRVGLPLATADKPTETIPQSGCAARGPQKKPRRSGAKFVIRIMLGLAIADKPADTTSPSAAGSCAVSQRAQRPPFAGARQ